MTTDKQKWWLDTDGNIRFQVISDGTSGADLFKRLEEGDHNVGYHAGQVLLSPDFKPTNGVTTEIVVMRAPIFSSDLRVMKNVLAKASKGKYVTPNFEVACLIRFKFTDKEIEDMGLWGIVTIHEPIKGSDGGQDLNYAFRDAGGRWLYPYDGRIGFSCFDVRGFAFVDPNANILTPGA